MINDRSKNESCLGMLVFTTVDFAALLSSIVVLHSFLDDIYTIGGEFAITIVLYISVLLLMVATFSFHIVNK